LKEEISMQGKLDRREFLLGSGVSLGTAGLLAGCGPEEPTTETAAPEIGLTSANCCFLLGFQSYSLRHFSSRDAFMREAEKLGLNYVELYRGHLKPSAPLGEVRTVRDGLAAIGLKVNAYGVEKLTADSESNEALFKFGKELGITSLSASPTKDAFPSLNRLVKQYDIKIAIHNHGPEDEQWRRPEWILEAVKDLDPRIGACVDTGHYLRAGITPVEAIEMLSSRVLGVHLKDFDANLREVIPGDGEINLDETLDALKRIGFDGPLSLEYEEHPENPVPQMQQAIRRVRAWESKA
jgi:sugar phosphate isomerase/epimerase